MSTIMSPQMFQIVSGYDAKEAEEVFLQVKDSASYDVNDVDDISNHKDRIIEGYANVPIIDRVSDLVEPKAFEKSLPVYMKNPIIRRNHNKNEAIGRVLEAKITKKGLWIKAQIGRGTRASDETWRLIVQKILRGFSVYGRIVKKTPTQNMEGKQYNHVTEFELQEIGIVDIPANQDSLFGITKKSVDDNMEDTETQPKEEVGNETVQSDNKVEKALANISDTLQKLVELQVNLLESNVTMAKEMSEMKSMAAQPDDMDGDGYDDEYDEDFEEEGLDEEKSLTETDELKAQISDLEDQIKFKGLEDEVNSLKAQLKDQSTPVEDAVPEEKAEETELPVDIDTEEAVIKAVKKSVEANQEQEEEKQEDSRLLAWIEQELPK